MARWLKMIDRNWRVSIGHLAFFALVDIERFQIFRFPNIDKYVSEFVKANRLDGDCFHVFHVHDGFTHRFSNSLMIVNTNQGHTVL